jgi:hypothetical protein
VSKKSARKRLNASASAATNGSVENASKLTSPTRLKSGEPNRSSGQRAYRSPPGTPW